MKQPNIDPKTNCVVTWEDASTDSSSQFESIDLAMLSYKPCLRRSTGLFVGIATKDGRKALLIASDDDGTPTSPEAVGGIMQIPWGMVTDITTLVEEAPKRKRRSS